MRTLSLLVAACTALTSARAECSGAWGLKLGSEPQSEEVCLPQMPELKGKIDRWGWSNKIHRIPDCIHTDFLDVWKDGANETCDTANGHIVAFATVEFDATGDTVTVEVFPEWGFRLESASLHFSPTAVLPNDDDGAPTPVARFFEKQTDGPAIKFHMTNVEQDEYNLALYVKVCDDGEVQPPASGLIVRQDDRVLPPQDAVEEMPGWQVSQRRATLTKFPKPLQKPNLKVYFPEQLHGIPTGVNFSIECPENANNVPCEAFISVYHCPPCSTGFNGGFPTILHPIGGTGWGPCTSMRFTLEGVLESFPTYGFHRMIPAGTTHTLPPTITPLGHVAIFARTGASDPASCQRAAQQPPKQHVPQGPVACTICAERD